MTDSRNVLYLGDNFKLPTMSEKASDMRNNLNN